MKVNFRNRGVQVATAVVVVLLLVLVLWLVFRPSQAQLEQNVAVKSAETKAGFSTAGEKAATDRKETEGAVTSRDQDRSSQNPRVLELERQLTLERDARRQQDARTIALLSQRTQARQADVAHVATASQPENRARAIALVGEMVAPDETYKAVIRLAVNLDQARDDLAVAKDTLASNSKELVLLQRLADERQKSLESEQRHSDQIAAMAKKHEEEHETTLAELRLKSEAERAANEKLVRRLKGNGVWNGVKTGAKIGAGIVIGIGIGKVMN